MTNTKRFSIELLLDILMFDKDKLKPTAINPHKHPLPDDILELIYSYAKPTKFESLVTSIQKFRFPIHDFISIKCVKEAKHKDDTRVFKLEFQLRDTITIFLHETHESGEVCEKSIQVLTCILNELESSFQRMLDLFGLDYCYLDHNCFVSVKQAYINMVIECDPNMITTVLATTMDIDDYGPHSGYWSGESDTWQWNGEEMSEIDYA